MTCDLHAPTRRELLLASGTLFAWAYLPKARARRGPRSAPAGDRAARRARWPGRGGAGRRSGLDRAARRQGAHARRQAAGAAARRLLRAQSGDAEPASSLQGRRRHHRACGGDALSRALAFRRPGRAGKRPRQARRGRYRLAQSRARLAAAGRPRRSAVAKPSRSVRSRRWSCAGRRRCCHGRRRACRRPATTR